MEGQEDEAERQDLEATLMSQPSDPLTNTRPDIPPNAPSWWTGEDDEAYSAQAAMATLGRVVR